MKSLQELQRNWEGFAQTDPLWAICSDPAKKSNRWSREEFFATGKSEIEAVLGCAAEVGVPIDSTAPALDFGCGVGRLTRALAAYFPECCGVDISPTMIGLAQQFNQDLPRCRFLLNEKDNLEDLQDNYFGFIYTSIVLQHIAAPFNQRYIAEFVRILKPGGTLIFQMPDRLRGGVIRKWRAKLALRSKIKSLLGGGKLFNMEMHCLEESAVRNLMTERGAQVMDVRLTNSTDLAFSGQLKYLKHEPESGYVSKQYCVVKHG
ncbi:MAG TPA: class I SAM-dependent methyltransferase [Candidatus Angelobacter sp.]|nr:class I SAM-dependent methyltransferase [Candidatus Angelobacter sp.]